MVIEVPAGLLGLLDDAAFDYVTDIGALGADKGRRWQIPTLAQR